MITNSSDLARPMFRSVDPLFRPRTVAIVGASDTGGAGWPRLIHENLANEDHSVRVYLINPRRESLWDQPVYPNFAALPEPVDLALTIVPAETVPDVLREGRAHGLRGALVFAARFGEGGDAAGRARAEALRGLAADGLRMCGPNCMGSISIAERLFFYPAAHVRSLPRGPVGVVFQSGGTFQFWLAQAAVRGVGFSYAVSSGNELDLDIADYVNFMVEDRETKVIVCMVEGVRRPEAFVAAAEKALAAGKPVLVLKIGRSERGRASTQSHTGALAGDDDVFDAVCHRYGMVRCYALDDLIETALAFQKARIPAGRRVAMVGYSGGAKGLFLDYASAEGLDIATLSEATRAEVAPLIDAGVPAENPLDCGAGLAAQPERFGAICRALVRDPNVDVLSVQGRLPASDTEPFRSDVFASILAETPDTTVVAHERMTRHVAAAGRAAQDVAGFPFLQGLPETVRAIKALIGYGEARRRDIAPPPPAAPRERIEGAALEETLRAHGLTPPASRFAATSKDAAAAAEAVGFPVALKIVSPQAVHKTEVGGVTLGLTDEVAVRAEADAMAARLRAARPDATIDGFLVQEMVDGVELILGVRRDPQYGPFMVVGLGGVLVEAIKDVAFRLLPVGEDDARAMLGELRGAALLDEFRGRPACDRDAIVHAIRGLSSLYLAHSDRLADLEINPLIALADGRGVRAVDVRLIQPG